MLRTNAHAAQRIAQALSTVFVVASADDVGPELDGDNDDGDHDEGGDGDDDDDGEDGSHGEDGGDDDEEVE